MNRELLEKKLRLWVVWLLLARKWCAMRTPPLVIKVVDYCSIAAEDLSRPCRQPAIVRARARVCYLATRRYRIAGADLAARLGYSTSAVSQAAKRGQQIFEDEWSLHVLLEKVDS